MRWGGGFLVIQNGEMICLVIIGWCIPVHFFLFLFPFLIIFLTAVSLWLFQSLDEVQSYILVERSGERSATAIDPSFHEFHHLVSVPLPS